MSRFSVDRSGFVIVDEDINVYCMEGIRLLKGIVGSQLGTL